MDQRETTSGVTPYLLWFPAIQTSPLHLFNYHTCTDRCGVHINLSSKHLQAAALLNTCLFSFLLALKK